MKILLYISGISGATYNTYVNTLSNEPSDLTHDEKLIASDVEDIKLLGLRYIHEFYRSVPFRPKITFEMIEYMLSLNIEQFRDAVKWVDFSTSTF